MDVKSPAMRMLGMVLGLFLSCSRLPGAESHPPLPPEVVMNADAGRGAWLIVKLQLADGREVPMVLDTGTSGIWLDKSLIPKMSKKWNSVSMRTFDAYVKGGVYAAPKLYLDGVQLETGRIVYAADLSKLSSHLKPPMKGVLGMDCLRHYCVQLDFQSGKVRFLNPAHLDTAALGKSYHLTFSTNSDWPDLPVIHHAGLLGGGTSTIMDTGNTGDGMAPGRAIRQSARGSYSGGLIKRTKHFLAVEGWVNHPVGSLNCVWDNNTYTNLGVGRGPKDNPNWIGLRFLARHLVTFDFPNATMYLKQTSIGPLEKESNTTGISK